MIGEDVSARRTMPSGPLAGLMKWKSLLLLGLVLALLAWNGYAIIRHFVAEAHCNTVTNSTLNRDQDPDLEEIKRAIWWNPDNAKYWNKLAGKLWSIRSGGHVALSDEESHEQQLEVVTALEKAVRLNPFEAQYHALLGWEYSYLWQDPQYHEKWLPAADASMDRAAYFAGDKDSRLYLTIGNYWVMRSKTFLPSAPQWESARTNARRCYAKAMDLEKSKKLQDEIAAFVWKFYPDKAMVQDILPSGHEPRQVPGAG